MKPIVGTFISIIILGGFTSLMSCNLPIQPGFDQGNSIVDTNYSTVSALLTGTARAFVPVSTTSSPAHTQTVSSDGLSTTQTPILPSVTPGDLNKTGSPSVAQNQCDLAQAGIPIDITIPDDTRLHPGEYFSKTWRILNAGNCTWNQDYAVVWFSGNQLGLVTAQPLSEEVRPGEDIEVTVEMIAPLTPGTYQSNWKMRNNQGELFGIGPYGNASFWVKIIVVPVDTPTSTATLPLASPTSVVYTSGSLFLTLGNGIDLDSGLADIETDLDISWILIDENNTVISPENGAKAALFGVNVPQINDCLDTQLSESPIDQVHIQEGTFLCYRTTEGLPGRLYIASIDKENEQMGIEFITWFVP